MNKIKEVVRYGVTTELSERAIGRALQVSRSAVTKHLEWFHRSGLTWEQAQGVARQRAADRVGAQSHAAHEPTLRATGRAVSNDGQGAAGAAVVVDTNATM